MADNDPLAELLLDADEVDRAQLAQALRGILGIDNASGRVVLKPAFNDLDASRKTLAYLMGAKVAALLNKSDTEAVTPTQLSKSTGMPKGTVNPKLTRLHEERLVSKTKSGAYYLEPHQVLRAVDAIRSGSE
ncbi:MAG: hypothetical protein ACRDKF_16795 [Actinomycetota bacterium]